MSLAVTSGELVESLASTVERFNDNNYRLGLFKNNITPTSETVIGDITPCDFGGYAGLQTITDWSPGSVTYDSPRAVAEHGPITFTNDGGSTNTVYGYYVVDGAGALAWAEARAGGGVTFGGDTSEEYVVTPVYTRRSEFHST